MEKPSRRRRLLLRPLPLPRINRFILSHPMELRMGKRGRQIHGSAPMGNISELKRGLSRVTPGCTSQSLTSSSKVQDKCEIRSDADPIQRASGGPGQVAPVATHSGSSSSPPLYLSNCPDEFKPLETDRLRPCDVKNPSALQEYDVYLHWFYNSHRGPAPVASLVDTASMCLEKEESMMSLWCRLHACGDPSYSIVHECIDGYLKIVIGESETEHPYGIIAAECIAKEAELITEWLKHGRIFFTDDDYDLCHNIRALAAKLFISDWKWSVHIAAAVVGIRKEAEWLIENLKHNSVESTSTSMKIRQFALDFVWDKLEEIEPYKSEQSSESEMTSESDDDVAESYMGGCSDKDYMNLY